MGADSHGLINDSKRDAAELRSALRAVRRPCALPLSVESNARISSAWSLHPKQLFVSWIELKRLGVNATIRTTRGSGLISTRLRTVSATLT